MDNIKKEFEYCAKDLEALKKRVMYRIYCLWFLRSAYSKVALFGLLFLASSLYMSFPSIIKNAMPTAFSFGGFFGFLFNNFLVADVVAKSFTVVITFTAGYVAWDVAKRIKYPSIMGRFFGGRRAGILEAN